MKKPSISELLSLLDKPALLKWANKQGLAGINISTKRKEWLSKGSSVHAEIENFVCNGVCMTSEPMQDNFIRFISDKKILSFETNVETEYFTGRYDMKLQWNDKVYLIDFKKEAKRIYLEMKLQLVGYSMVEEVDSFAVVSYPDFTVMNFSPVDRTPYIEILKSLSNIYRQKQLIEDGI